jgi:aflatoxin B1 aldehyde reductase
MTFGWSQTSSYVDESVALEMVQKFMDYNNNESVGRSGSDPHHIDTARIYAGGKTERILGSVFRKLRADAASAAAAADAPPGTPPPPSMAVGTKAAPSVRPGGLSQAGIEEQFQSSMDAMGLTACEEYYLHQPDTEHPLLESLKCADSLVKDGRVSKIGMSNYHAKEVARAFQLCKEHGLTPPTVYQGLYNPLNRLVEDELLPVLRENGCSFVAYNPLVS